MSTPERRGEEGHGRGGRRTSLAGVLDCSVCLESYTEERERRPLMLPSCGHTFCRMCLTSIMAWDSERGTFLCPACRSPQTLQSIDALPVNYSLLEVARRDRDALSTHSPPSHSSGDGHNEEHKHQQSCVEHGARVVFWCENCEEAACGECLYEVHTPPHHHVTKLTNLHTEAIIENVRVRGTRLVSQLSSAIEENTGRVTADLLVLVEQLRQQRRLHQLLHEARVARATVRAATKLSAAEAAATTMADIQHKFNDAHITTQTRVWVGGPGAPPPPIPEAPPPTPVTPLGNKPPLPPRPVIITTPAPYPASRPQDSWQGSVATTPATPPPLPWPRTLCGTFSGNWTSSRLTLEPRGLHVYCLNPIKDKCDLFLNLSVVSGLAPTEAPLVFLDLQDETQLLGRVYITLQIHLRRAQQFFSLCLGDKGPSYQGSSFHSVLRRGGVGEGLVGGDYEGKGGKGGGAVLEGVEGEKEVAKRCERGMVMRANARKETAAQFLISVRDGSRTKLVYPFGRVCEGIDVVERACERPPPSVTIQDCGWVLPV